MKVGWDHLCLLSPHCDLYLSKADDGHREAEASKLLSDLVNCFDTTHITAAEEPSNDFYQPASRLLLTMTSVMQSWPRQQPHLWAYQENSLEEEAFLRAPWVFLTPEKWLVWALYRILFKSFILSMAWMDSYEIARKIKLQKESQYNHLSAINGILLLKVYLIFPRYDTLCTQHETGKVHC